MNPSITLIDAAAPRSDLRARRADGQSGAEPPFELELARETRRLQEREDDEDPSLGRAHQDESTDRTGAGADDGEDTAAKPTDDGRLATDPLPPGEPFVTPPPPLPTAIPVVAELLLTSRGPSIDPALENAPPVAEGTGTSPPVPSTTTARVPSPAAPAPETPPVSSGTAVPVTTAAPVTTATSAPGAGRPAVDASVADATQSSAEASSTTTTPAAPGSGDEQKVDAPAPRSRAATAEVRTAELRESRRDARAEQSAARAVSQADPEADTGDAAATLRTSRGGSTPVVPAADRPTLTHTPPAAPVEAPRVATASAPPTAPSVPQNLSAEHPTPATPAATSTAPGTPPTGVPVQSILSQIQMHVRAKGVRDLRLRLDPPELGRLHLRFLLDGDTIKVVVRAQSQEVVAALKSELSSFHNALRDSGIDLGSLDIDLDGGREAHGMSFDENGSHGSGHREAEGGAGRSSKSDQPASTTRPLMTTRGRLDVIA